MSDYGLFEDLSHSPNEQRIASLKEADKLNRAIQAVQDKFGSFLNSSTGLDDFDNRVALVKDDMRKVVEASGIFPRTGNMRRVVNACKAEFKKQALNPDVNADEFCQECEHSVPGHYNNCPAGGKKTDRNGIPVKDVRYLFADQEADDTPIIPDGNFDSYLDSVDNGAPEKVEQHNFVAASYAEGDETDAPAYGPDAKAKVNKSLGKDLNGEDLFEVEINSNPKNASAGGTLGPNGERLPLWGPEGDDEGYSAALQKGHLDDYGWDFPDSDFEEGPLDESKIRPGLMRSNPRDKQSSLSDTAILASIYTAYDPDKSWGGDPDYNKIDTNDPSSWGGRVPGSGKYDKHDELDEKVQRGDYWKNPQDYPTFDQLDPGDTDWSQFNKRSSLDDRRLLAEIQKLDDASGDVTGWYGDKDKRQVGPATQSSPTDLSGDAPQSSYTDVNTKGTDYTKSLSKPKNSPTQKSSSDPVQIPMWGNEQRGNTMDKLSWKTAESWSGQGEVPCKKCGKPTDKLDLFPGGVCLGCHSSDPQVLHDIDNMSGEDLANMWGADVLHKESAAGNKNHLQNAGDSITELLNQLAQDFQDSIGPLQEAMQAIEYAKQVQQQSSPMGGILPPGGINVLPQQQSPNGAPALGQPGFAPAPQQDAGAMAQQMVNPAAPGGPQGGLPTPQPPQQVAKKK